MSSFAGKYAILLWICALLCPQLVLSIKNPIIPGWNPDPAILRVEDEYFIATSSFTYSPGVPIYKSRDLTNWELYSHAMTSPDQLLLYGTPTAGGVWAPSLAYIKGRFYLASMTRWTYDPMVKVWPRVYWVSSTDLKEWTVPTYSEPYGIDPELFHDPVSDKVYLNLMAPSANEASLWGIYQCEVSLETGKCIGSYRSLWNGTLPVGPDARPEGPKMFIKDDMYYLLIAEGGTDEGHRATIARSDSPEGPWISSPTNPLLYNGANPNLTVQSTGHATIVDTPDGEYYASFLARRNINGASPLGRETFLTKVTWSDDGWPTFNDGNPILLSESFGDAPDQEYPAPPFTDRFEGQTLDPSWSQRRMPYTENYHLAGTSNNYTTPSGNGGESGSGSGGGGGVILHPNVFTLSDRDVPAALLRKQTSLNMTFSARLLPFKDDDKLGFRQTIGISAFLSELQHQDIGLRGCPEEEGEGEGLCLYTTLMKNETVETTYHPLPIEPTRPLSTVQLTLLIRAHPETYHFGYHLASPEAPLGRTQWLTSLESSWLAFAPGDWFVFEGAMFGLFASGNGEPWAMDAAQEVGFAEVREEYYKEGIPDYDNWERV